MALSQFYFPAALAARRLPSPVPYPTRQTRSNSTHSRRASESGNMRRLPGHIFALALAGRVVAALALIGAAAPTSNAAAAAPRWPVGAGGPEALAGVDGELRLRWIDAHLSTTAHHARVWTWSWGTGIVVATI